MKVLKILSHEPPPSPKLNMTQRSGVPECIHALYNIIGIRNCRRIGAVELLSFIIIIVARHFERERQRWRPVNDV